MPTPLVRPSMLNMPNSASADTCKVCVSLHQTGNEPSTGLKFWPVTWPDPRDPVNTADPATMWPWPEENRFLRHCVSCILKEQRRRVARWCSGYRASDMWSEDREFDYRPVHCRVDQVKLDFHPSVVGKSSTSLPAGVMAWRIQLCRVAGNCVISYGKWRPVAEGRVLLYSALTFTLYIHR